ncbi:Respiratory chain complex assembly or maintenance protein [Sorochytrium milnesiophthora]
MHPALDQPNLQDCERLIQELNECHRTAGLRKYIGACNDIAAALNKCLDADFAAKRAKNLEKARKDRATTEKVWSDLNLDRKRTATPTTTAAASE